ncbi:hypothetical protein [Amycolatopsis sp. TNS106]|uniref:hypothetical protein n=1 Tax=Amycolatopsis sp. TNS106 TaxID=2861750 RepID=UPI001C582DCD|nr:hypothetical protein [Amycolatopsis sp. TNS106]QXV57482.1 hypothetical protein CVV72_11080 [Amycolatopsis sp. TNS106]
MHDPDPHTARPNTDDVRHSKASKQGKVRLWPPATDRDRPVIRRLTRPTDRAGRARNRRLFPQRRSAHEQPGRTASRPVWRVITAVFWGVFLAITAGLATWSGKYYLPMPWWPVVVLAAGLTATAMGWALGDISLSRNPILILNTCAFLVSATVTLGVAGQPADIGFAPDPWAGVRDYRGSCLSGTEYTHLSSQLSITTDTVTVVGSQGGTLRFTRTEDGWPSGARAEIWGRGVVPRDRATRLALASSGCG